MNDVEMATLLDSITKMVYTGVNDVVAEAISASGVTPEEFTEKKVLVTIAITTAIQRHFNAGLKVLGTLGGIQVVCEHISNLCNITLKEVSMRALTNVSAAEKFEQN